MYSLWLSEIEKEDLQVVFYGIRLNLSKSLDVYLVA